MRDAELALRRCNALAENARHLVNLRRRHDERRRERREVVATSKQKAPRPRLALDHLAGLDLRGEALLGVAVLGEFHPLQQAGAADVADYLVALGDLEEALAEPLALLARVLHQIALDELRHGGDTRGAGDGIAGIGVAVVELHVLVILAVESRGDAIAD